MEVGVGGAGDGVGGVEGESGGLDSFFYGLCICLTAPLSTHVDTVVLSGGGVTVDILFTVVPEGIKRGDSDFVLVVGLFHSLPEYKIAKFCQILQPFTINPRGKLNYHHVLETVGVLKGFFHNSQGF